jgi:hypothetical protein
VDPTHPVVGEILKEELGPLVTSEVAVAEADYLILTHLVIDVELAFLDDPAGGARRILRMAMVLIEPAPTTGLERSLNLLEVYRNRTKRVYSAHEDPHSSLTVDGANISERGSHFDSRRSETYYDRRARDGPCPPGGRGGSQGRGCLV